MKILLRQINISKIEQKTLFCGKYIKAGIIRGFVAGDSNNRLVFRLSKIPVHQLFTEAYGECDSSVSKY